MAFENDSDSLARSLQDPAVADQATFGGRPARSVGSPRPAFRYQQASRSPATPTSEMSPHLSASARTVCHSSNGLRISVNGS